MSASYPWVRMIIRRKGWFLPSGADHEDLVQEGVLAVFESLEDWDPELTPTFTNFGQMVVERQMMEIITKANRQKRKAMNNALSLDAPLSDDDESDRLSHWDLHDASGLGQDPAALVAESEATEIVVVLSEGLSDIERMALTRCILGSERYEEVAADLGVAFKSIDNAVQRVRRKVLSRLGSLSHDERFTEETRGLLKRLGSHATQRRRVMSDEELRARLPIEALRFPSLNKFGREHHRWIVPPARILIEYPEIRQFVTCETKRVVLDGYLEGRSWAEIAEQAGVSASACQHHLRRLCQKAAKTSGKVQLRRSTSTPLLQRVEQLWLKGHTVREIVGALAYVASEAEVRSSLTRVWQRTARRNLQTVSGAEIQTRRIPLVRLSRIPALLREVKHMLCPEYVETLKLYMQGYSHEDIAARREVAPSCIGKNDLPAIRRKLKGLPAFAFLYDPRIRERQGRLLALEALGLTADVALDRIPDQHQEMFGLYLDGHSYKEIDQALRLPKGAAEKRLHYCRSLLRRQNARRDRRWNVPARSAAKRRRANPGLFERFARLGHLLNAKDRRLLERWFAGDSRSSIHEWLVEQGDRIKARSIWAKVQRLDVTLSRLAESLGQPQAAGQR